MMDSLSLLNVLLYGERVGTLINLGHDRTLFSFNESYIENSNRAVLGLRFQDSFGELITEYRPTRTRLMPYFSNLLPEGHLRDYLSQRAGVNSEREFFLLWVLGLDLPGAVSTVSYMKDEQAALRFSKSKRFDEFSIDELKHLSAKARLPEKVVLDSAKETVELFQEHWQKEKSNLPIYPEVVEVIDKHIGKVPIVKG